MKEKVYNLPEDTETIWTYCQYHIGDWIEMYTTDKVMMHRYEEFSRKYPDYCKLAEDTEYSMTFMIDPKCMGFKPKVPRKGPALSEEQKQANRERLERMNKQKNKKR